MRLVGFHNLYPILKGRFMLAVGALLWAVIGIGRPALADPLPSSGTCRMLVVKSSPPPGSIFRDIVSAVVSITFGTTPTVTYNIVRLGWNECDMPEGSTTCMSPFTGPTLTQESGQLSNVTITPGVNTSGTALSGFNGLKGTAADGLIVAANLIPVNNSNTILAQFTAPEPLNGVCQME